MPHAIRITPLTGAIGAEIEGLDLRQGLDGDTREAIHRALMDHLVVFFRDQPLTAEQQLAFAENFGERQLSSRNASPDDGLDAWFVTLHDTPEVRPRSDRWHTDVPFETEPPDIAVLSMPEPAPIGGDTLWASLYALYDGLSPAMQRFVDGLHVEFDMGPSKEAARQLYGEEFYRELLANEPRAVHPLVRVHPVTGRRAVFLGGAFTKRIVELDAAESDDLIASLKRRLDDPNLQVRWRWQQHDVAMWDERCTNHRALADHYPAHRTVRRCCVGAGVPVGPST